MLRLQALQLCASVALTVAAVLPHITASGAEESTETIPSCALASSGCLFAIRNIAYQKYEPFPGTIDQGMDSITMAFDVTNNGNGIKTACSFVNGKYLGEWTDYGTKWYACGNRTVVDGSGAKYVVRTNAQFQWDTWSLAVNQTWLCGDGYDQQSTVAANVSVLLAPACTNTSNTAYSFKQCSAPDTAADTFPFS